MFTGITIAHENFLLGRFDYNLSDKDSFCCAISMTSSTSSIRTMAATAPCRAGICPIWPERDEGRNHFATVEWRRIITPTLINTMRVSFSRPNTGDYEVNSVPGINSSYPASGIPMRKFRSRA